MRDSALLKGCVASTVLLVWAAASADFLRDEKIYFPPDYNTMPLPAVGESYEDPVFGTVIHRMTDALADGAEYLTPEYASSDLFNADESMVRIMGDRVEFYSTTPPFRLMRRKSLGAGSTADYWWDVHNPNLLYYRPYGNTLRVYDYSEDRDSKLHSFDQYSRVQSLGESNLSLDGDRLALYGDGRYVFVYEFSTSSVVAALDTNAAPFGGKGVSDVTVTPSGRGVIIGWNGRGGGGRTQGMEYFEIQGSGLVFRRQLWVALGHHDVGQSTDGTDYLVHVDSALGSNHVFAVRISDGHATDVGTFGGEGFWHDILLSTNSMHHDDYIYAAMYKMTEVSQAGWVKPWINEIIRVPVRGGPIERIAHHRTRPHGGYYWTPRGSVSRSGSFFVYPSNFNRQASERGIPANYVDSYLIDLAQVSPEMPSLTNLGDIDGSGRVDGADLVLLGIAFGSADGDSSYSSDADINQDAMVDGFDLAILADYFGQDVGSSGG